MRQLAIDHVQVGPADGAGFDLQQDLSRTRLGTRPFH
jgi:hypothetical protein